MATKFILVIETRFCGLKFYDFDLLLDALRALALAKKDSYNIQCKLFKLTEKWKEN